MSREWFELESDPGVFTLLLAEFGVQGVQVEEIYDLSKPIEEKVYGFIFLFRWSEDRKVRRKLAEDRDTYETDPTKVANIFFAQQIVPNSCATHSLISVLLNCSDLELGGMLTKFKEFTKNMTPEDKGLSIGSKPELARAHNKHARPVHNTFSNSGPASQTGNQSLSLTTRGGANSTGVKAGDTFHFVCYLPVQGCLYELDGLKPYPIDHGRLVDGVPWTDQFKEVIQERMKEADQQDVRYSLMSVVPDRRQALSDRLTILDKNQNIIRDTLSRMLEAANILPTNNPASSASPPTIPTTTVTPAAHTTSTDTPHQSNLPGDTGSGETSQVTPGSQRKMAMTTRSSKRTSAPASFTSSVQSTDDPSSLIQLAQTSPMIQLLPEISRLKESECPVRAQVVVQDPSGGHENLPCATVAATDVTKPLTIETRFPPVPATSEPPASSTPPLPVDTTAPIVATTTPPVQTSRSNRASKYPTRSSTRRDTLASNSLASTRATATSPGGPVSPLDHASVTGDQATSIAQGIHRRGFTPQELVELLIIVEDHMRCCQSQLAEECEKRRRYTRDHCRRTFDYDSFIRTFLSMLHRTGQLEAVIKEQQTVTAAASTSRKRGASTIGTSSSTAGTTATKRVARSSRH